MFNNNDTSGDKKSSQLHISGNIGLKILFYIFCKYEGTNYNEVTILRLIDDINLSFFIL